MCLCNFPARVLERFITESWKVISITTRQTKKERTAVKVLKMFSQQNYLVNVTRTATTTYSTKASCIDGKISNSELVFTRENIKLY